MVQVLKQCGDNLTRENVMKQAANLKNFKLPLLLPGMAINTSPTDFFPVEQAQLPKFTGTQWQLLRRADQHRRALAAARRRRRRRGRRRGAAGPLSRTCRTKRHRLSG